jgi:hypothetical protein
VRASDGSLNELTVSARNSAFTVFYLNLRAARGGDPAL